MRRLSAFYPLSFLTVGLVFLFFSEHDMQSRIRRDAADLRQDLQEAGVSRAELAVLMSAHAKIEANAVAFTSSTGLLNLILAAAMAIPVYARLRDHEPGAVM